MRLPFHTTLPLTALFLLLASHASLFAQLTEAEKELADEVDFPEAVIDKVKLYGEDPEQLVGFDGEGNPAPAKGITIAVIPEGAILSIAELRAALGEEYVVFRSEQNDGKGPDRIAVLKSRDQFDAIRAMGTNGANYDLGPEEIIEKLKEWDETYEIRLRSVGFDWLEFEFVNLPDDPMPLAQEIYEFCPDTVDQGIGSVEALAQYIGEFREFGRIYLWWD